MPARFRYQIVAATAGACAVALYAAMWLRSLERPHILNITTRVVAFSRPRNARAPMHYRVKDLGAPDMPQSGKFDHGDYTSGAEAINQSGLVLVSSPNSVPYCALFTLQGGKFRALPSPFRTQMSLPGGINAAGHVVGNLYYHDVSWIENPGFTVIWRDGECWRLFQENRVSWAACIDAADNVVGFMHVEGGDKHAFLWNDGHAVDLGTLMGGDSAATAINSNGLIVGYSAFGRRPLLGKFQRCHGFMWKNGVMCDLGTLGGHACEADGINDLNQIVGTSTTADDEDHAFELSDGIMYDLESPGPTLCQALKINNNGIVVGHWLAGSQLSGRAMVWIDNCVYDLNNLIPKGSGWVLEDARDINDNGVIVGLGKHYGISRGFLLTPVQNVQ